MNKIRVLFIAMLFGFTGAAMAEGSESSNISDLFGNFFTQSGEGGGVPSDCIEKPLGTVICENDEK